MPEARHLQDQHLRDIMNAEMASKGPEIVPKDPKIIPKHGIIVPSKNREVIPKLHEDHEIIPKQHEMHPKQNEIDPQRHEMPPKQHEMPPKQHEMFPKRHEMAIRQDLDLRGRDIAPGSYALKARNSGWRAPEIGPDGRAVVKKHHHKAHLLNKIKGRDQSNLFKNSVSVSDPIKVSPQGERQDIPFFWVIPKSGTSSMRSIMTKCVNARMASTSGLVKPNEDVQRLEIMDLGKKGKFLNIDFSHPDGIKRAGELNLASSGLIDVAATSHVHPGVEVFTRNNPARMFSIFRHPVTRMISAFHYSKVAHWETTYREDMKELTVAEYTRNPKYSVDNWMTRMLADVHGEELDDDDLEYAKQVLRERVFVLLLDDIAEGVDRLLTYLDWHGLVEENPQGTKCIDAFVRRTPANQNKHEPVEAGSAEWQMFENVNRYDLQLYWYAQDLYHGEQKAMMNNMRQSPTRQTQQQH